jgi:hypothetical protein
MSFRNKQITLFGLALALVLFIFYFPFLAKQQSFYATDITYYFEPLTNFMANSIRAGRFPAWNPYSYCGMSQVAVPSPGIFYPPNWLFFNLSFNQALAASMILHQLIAGCACFLLIISLGWGSLAAVCAGLIFALNGYMFSLQPNFTLVAGAAWLPACLWSILELQRKTTFSFKYFCIACLCEFMLFTSGRPEVVAPSALLLLLVVATFFYRSAKEAGLLTAINRLTRQILALAVATLVSMPAILPTLEWLALSPRAQGFDTAAIFQWSANWYDLICLFIAQPFGDLTLTTNKALTLVGTYLNHLPYVESAFVGPIALTLTLKALFDKTWRWKNWTLALLLLSLVVAMGKNTAIAPWLLSQLPMAALVRFPSKLLFLPVFALAILAGRGAYLVVNQDKQKKGDLLSWTFWIISLLAGITVYAFSAVHTPEGTAAATVAQRETLMMQALIAKGLVIDSVVGMFFLSLIALFNKSKISKPQLVINASLLLAVSLLVPAFIFSRHATEANFFQQPSFVADKLKQLENIADSKTKFKPRILTIYMSPTACPAGYSKDSTPALYRYDRDLLVPLSNMDYAIPGSDGYEASVTGDYKKLLYQGTNLYDDQSESINGTPEAFSSASVRLYRFCQLTATKYVLTQCYSQSKTTGKDLLQEQLPAGSFNLVLEDKSMNVRIYQVINNLSRAYLTYNWRFANNHDDALKDVLQIFRSGFDPSASTIVESTSKDKPQPQTLADKGTGSINCLLDLPDNIELDISTSKPGLFVLADQYYPGWQATLDSKPIEIYRANTIERAVYIPAGTHHLSFSFKPVSLTIGVILALIGLTILLVMSLPTLFKRRTVSEVI